MTPAREARRCLRALCERSTDWPRDPKLVVVARYPNKSRAAGAREARRRHHLLNRGFWDRVDKSGGGFACWPWLGARQTTRFGTKAGYGYISVRGKVVYVHRCALELELGRPIGPGLVAMHSCDNPPCCNPAHLREGTRAENMADMAAKGRARAGGTKLTPVGVREIRRLRALGRTAEELAGAFGVSKAAVYDVIAGRRWGHVRAAAVVAA